MIDLARARSDRVPRCSRDRSCRRSRGTVFAAFLLLLLPLSGGCLGVELKMTKAVDVPLRGVGSFYVGREGNRWIVDGYGEEREIERTEIESAWGAPMRVDRRDGVESWEYTNDDLVWAGAILYAGIPVPLLVPVGKQTYVLDLKDDRVVKVEHDTSWTWGFACGPFLFLAELEGKKPDLEWLTIFCAAGKDMLW